MYGVVTHQGKTTQLLSMSTHPHLFVCLSRWFPRVYSLSASSSWPSATQIQNGHSHGFDKRMHGAFCHSLNVGGWLEMSQDW